MAYPDNGSRHGKLLDVLLAKAEWRGYLITEDLAEADSDDDFLALAESLRLNGVNVLDGEDEESPPATELDSSLPADINPSNLLDQVSIDDSVSLYLREMAITPLLKVEEEVDLARRIEQAGEARLELARLKGQDLACRREELEGLIQDGFRARDSLIRSNTRLVVSIARKYLGRGVPFLDLIQEGNLGLIRAVEKYEYQRGFRFSTYATWWIRQSISRAVADQSRTIRVPVHMTDRLRQLYRASQEMEQELGRSPTIQELADQLGTDCAKLQWMLRVTQVPLSLESPLGEDEDAEIGMYVEDENTPSPAQVVSQNMLRESMEEVLSTLSPREARILRLRFGLGQDRAYTLEEVGQKFGLTRERIRQIEGKALQLLRQPSRARLLREYI